MNLSGYLLAQAGLLEVLQGRVRQDGSQKATAQRLGISEQYLCDVLKRRREPGYKLLRSMGFRRICVYEKI